MMTPKRLLANLALLHSHAHKVCARTAKVCFVLDACRHRISSSLRYHGNVAVIGGKESPAVAVIKDVLDWVYLVEAP